MQLERANGEDAPRATTTVTSCVVSAGVGARGRGTTRRERRLQGTDRRAGEATQVQQALPRRKQLLSRILLQLVISLSFMGFFYAPINTLFSPSSLLLIIIFIGDI